MPEKSRLIKQLSLLITLFAALFSIWVVFNSVYPQLGAKPLARVAPKATPAPAPTLNATVLNVLIHDSYYGDTDTNVAKPPTWTVPAQADVVLNLDNEGKLKHNWAIVKQGSQIPSPYEEGQGGNILLYGVGMVYSKSKTTVTFTAPAPGEYVVICTVSGHYPTMQGRLVVK